jgi:hypothetical protein
LEALEAFVSFEALEAFESLEALEAFESLEAFQVSCDFKIFTQFRIGFKMCKINLIRISR